MEGYPSGQRGQTVNLLAAPTEVQILPPPPLIARFVRAKRVGYGIRGCNSVGRVTAFQAVGRGFDSRRPLNFFKGLHIAHVAQLAERVLGKDEVTSSILVVGSTID